jgi:hypothetical protein
LNAIAVNQLTSRSHIEILPSGSMKRRAMNQTGTWCLGRLARALGERDQPQRLCSCRLCEEQSAEQRDSDRAHAVSAVI